jgi:hypothetical protein
MKQSRGILPSYNRIREDCGEPERVLIKKESED